MSNIPSSEATKDCGSCQHFNPFTDRLSRDIRNDLSESLLEVLEKNSIEPAQSVADRFLAPSLPAVYVDYINSRISRYKIALSQLAGEEHVIETAAILWDLGLFFEVHEILEPAWMDVSGDEKRILQALIRAAGTYIKLELDYTPQARKISTKAIPVLEEFLEKLEPHLDVNSLVDSLKRLNTTPPKIGRRDGYK